MSIHACDMIEHLQIMFEVQARQERFNVSKAVYTCKQGEGDAVGPHVRKMLGYIDYRDTLGFYIGLETHSEFILQSLNNNDLDLL